VHEGLEFVSNANHLVRCLKTGRMTLEGNVMTGSIPTEWAGMTDLEALELVRTSSSEICTFPNCLRHLHSLLTIIFSQLQIQKWHNELVGLIPSEFGEMTNLRNVGLGHNFLQGQIPSELGQLTRLKTLDLQHTALKGAVPTELGMLETLGTCASTGADYRHCDLPSLSNPCVKQPTQNDNHLYSHSQKGSTLWRRW
jgi:hypothetical protein